MTHETFLQRPLPAIGRYLGETRAADFEDWLREYSDLETRLRQIGSMTEASAVRLIQILAVATTEAARQEHETYGRPIEEIALLLPRVAGLAVASPVLSVLREDTPRRWLRKTLTGEFDHGVRLLLQSNPPPSTPSQRGDDR